MKAHHRLSSRLPERLEVGCRAKTGNARRREVRGKLVFHDVDFRRGAEESDDTGGTVSRCKEKPVEVVARNLRWGNAATSAHKEYTHL